jgi:GTP-binding protein HflX
VRAFKSTLEEISLAHVCVHVLDAADEEVEHHLESVDEILKELEVDDKPRLLVWNKADVADPEKLAALVERHGGMTVAAAVGTGCEALLGRLERMLFQERRSRETAAAEVEEPPEV